MLATDNEILGMRQAILADPTDLANHAAYADACEERYGRYLPFFVRKEYPLSNAMSDELAGIYSVHGALVEGPHMPRRWDSARRLYAFCWGKPALLLSQGIIPDWPNVSDGEWDDEGIQWGKSMADVGAFADRWMEDNCTPYKEGSFVRRGSGRFATLAEINEAMEDEAESPNAEVVGIYRIIQTYGGRTLIVDGGTIIGERLSHGWVGNF